MAFEKKDNVTFDQKVSLRKVGLSLLDEPPVIMETHGGIGDIYSAIYHPYEDGVVLEKDSLKCEILSRQRPTWAVYQADSPLALKQGVGSHLKINFLDLDPYGDCWPTMQGFFESKRPFAKRMVVCVNDGLRQKVRTGGAWDSSTLEPVVHLLGNNIWPVYLEACKILLNQAVTTVGYRVRKFEGYYAGVGKKLTHFIAILDR